MRSEPHERFSSRTILTEADIAGFATACGDRNPLHHDREFARRSRYGGIIASGPQTSALLMGLVATHFSRSGPIVGVEFTFYFRAPVHANESLDLEWLVIRVSPTSRRSSELVELRGRLRTAAGVTAVGSKGTVLLASPSLSSPAA